MLATEERSSPTAERPSALAPLETHPNNERMRHIPSIPWMIQKLDGDTRRKVERLWLPYADLAASDRRHPAIEAELRALIRSLERVCHVARRHHGNLHPPAELGSRLNWTISQAVSCLTSADNDTFGRRFPSHTGERSNGEPLWAAMLSVIQHVQKLIPMIRELDPDIDERIYEGLVQLNEPLRREPIA
jgi:hypothetical protein